MDKFGIFNLLSSLLGNFTQKPEENNQVVTSPASPISFPSAKHDNELSAEKRANFPPLQNSMLLTMKSHDEFIKRVRGRISEKNGNKKF